MFEMYPNADVLETDYSSLEGRDSAPADLPPLPESPEAVQRRLAQEVVDNVLEKPADTSHIAQPTARTPSDDAEGTSPTAHQPPFAEAGAPTASSGGEGGSEGPPQRPRLPMPEGEEPDDEGRAGEQGDPLTESTDPSPEAAPTEGRPEELQRLAEALDYIEEATPRGFNSLFVALLKDELTEDLPADNDPNSLADFDVPDTEASKLQFEQQLNIMPYQSTLEAAGIKLGGDPFLPTLEIANGEKFVATLTTIPKSDEALCGGVEGVVRHSLSAIMNAYVPNSEEREVTAWYREPKLQPQVTENVAATDRYNAVTAETLTNATQIAAGLRELNTAPQVAVSLENARVADAENMLPQWAVADYWDLYAPPTTSFIDLEWTQWSTEEEWQKFHDFLDAAAAKAPPDSQFIQNLTTTMLDNIANLRDGELAASTTPSIEFTQKAEDKLRGLIRS